MDFEALRDIRQAEPRKAKHGVSIVESRQPRNPTPFNRQVEREFRIINTSGEIFWLESIRQSCDCTILDRDDGGGVIEPGGRVSIPYTVSSNGRSGEVQSNVFVHGRLGNRHTGESVTLIHEIKAFFLPEIWSPSKLLSFRDSDDGVRLATCMLFTSNPEVELQGVRSGSLDLEVQVLDAKRSEGHFKISLGLDGSNYKGPWPIRDFVHFDFSHLENGPPRLPLVVFNQSLASRSKHFAGQVPVTEAGWNDALR